MALAFHAHLQCYLSAVLDGETETFLGYLSLPLAVYVEDRTVVYSGPEVALEAAHQFSGVLKEAGAETVEACVVARSATRAERHSVWVAPTYRDASGAVVARSNVRYFLECGDVRPRIALIEVLDLPLQARMRALPIWQRAS